MLKDNENIEQNSKNMIDENNSFEHGSNANEHISQLLKAALQSLLKFGLLEADKKPNLYNVIRTQTILAQQCLAPLDLQVCIDEVRGIAFVKVVDDFDNEDDDWSHPLVRKQRLTLEQTLLIAVLRKHYIVHEKEAGLGSGNATVSLDDLAPELDVFLGDLGSDLQNEKRLRNLLDNLKGHGLVSEISSLNELVIRPIITHVANPETLTSLLAQLEQMVSVGKEN